jgi:uncharacterized RDD family membrane protein YckC
MVASYLKGAHKMSQENLNVVPENPQMDYNRIENITATAGARIGAHLLDGIISFVCTLPILFVYLPKMWEEIMSGIQAGNPNFDYNLEWYVPLYELVLAVILSLVVPVLTKGKTPGKAIVGLRIISKNGDYATVGQLVLRSLIYIVPALLAYYPIGLITWSINIIWIVSLVFIFTDRYHQAVHDKISNTIVVYDNLLKNRNVQTQ